MTKTMMMKLRYSILFLALQLTFSVNSQDVKETLTKLRANYIELANVSAVLKYKLYKGHSGTNLIESYSSEFKKSENKEYRKINQRESINTDSISIDINHITKTITLVDYQPIDYFQFNVKKSLKFCEKVSISTILNGYNITLFIKQKTDIPVSKIEIKVDSDFRIKETVLFYSNQINFSESVFNTELDYPRLVVEYQNENRNYKDKEGLFELKNYLIFQDGSPVLVSKFNEYQLIDMRKKH